jgi:hypothetical protein
MFILKKLIIGGAWSADGEYDMCGDCSRDVARGSNIEMACPYCGRYWVHSGWLSYGGATMLTAPYNGHVPGGANFQLILLLRLLGFAVSFIATCAILAANYSIRQLPLISTSLITVPAFPAVETRTSSYRAWIVQHSSPAFLHDMATWALSISSLLLLFLSVAFLVRGLFRFLFRAGIYLAWPPQPDRRNCSGFEARYLVAFLIGFWAGGVSGTVYLLSIVATSLASNHTYSIFLYLSLSSIFLSFALLLLHLFFPPLFWPFYRLPSLIARLRSE